MNPSESKKTILYDSHVELNAKMAPFGGYEMPIQYQGIFAEHFATRKQAAIFDTCHMGEFTLRGARTSADLDKILSCPVSTMKAGQCRYGFICNPSGGVLDDQIIYKISDTEFFMVVNASTQDADFEWVKSHVSPSTSIENISRHTGKIDLQGPTSAKIMEKLFDDPIGGLKYYHWMHNRYNGQRFIISRTGYTGEIGFEIYLDINLTRKLWDDCLDLGAKPAGLGARDTLRLEMGYPLYGHELDNARNAAESGFSRAIANDKEFIGSSVVLDPSKANYLLCGMRLDGRRAARNGDAVQDGTGAVIGNVTSGSYSPSLECAIALGYVKKDKSAPGTRVFLCTDRAKMPAAIVELPFYKNATARKNLSEYL
jgi:aminomethyltransferase